MDHSKQNVSTLIVIVNWRSPWDSLECLESLLQQGRDDWTAVVVDNASGDDSLDIFKTWAEGKLCGLKSTGDLTPQLATLAYSDIRPRVNFLSSADLDRQAAKDVCENLARKDVIFIANHVNGGFAAGNNVGLRLAPLMPDLEWVWLLNNDTVVDRDALNHLVHKSQGCIEHHIVGASVMEYYKPDHIQYNAGAIYNRFTAKVSPIKYYPPGVDGCIAEGKVEKVISYIAGASMFLPLRTFQKIGLMREDYFLYYEELDWVRPQLGNIKLLYASKAKIYHKEGGATGGKTNSDRKGWTAEYYSARSRLLYTLLNQKAAIIPILFLQVAVVFKRLFLRGDINSARTIISAIRDAVGIYSSKRWR